MRRDRAAEDASRGGREPAPAAGVERGAVKLLIIEDDADWGDSLEHMFSVEGHDCDLARTGAGFA